MQRYNQELFGNKSNVVQRMITLYKHDTDLEFEFRLCDTPNEHLSKDRFKTFNPDTDYEYVEEILHLTTDVSNDKYRSTIVDGKEVSHQIKKCINKVVGNKNNEMYLVVKLSSENNVTNSGDIDKGYMFKQRRRYIWGNWYIDKTIRIYKNTYDEISKLKLSDRNMTMVGLYDELDIEFEYRANNDDMYEDIIKLYKYIFPSIIMRLDIVDILPIPINRLPNVYTLSHNIVDTQDPQDYVYLEKTDGERRILILGPKSYEISMKEEVIPLDIYTDNTCIFDCEKYNDIYYVFDTLMISRNLLMNREYVERMRICGDFFKLHEYPNIKLKPYYEIPSWATVINYVNTYRISRVTGNRIDGAVVIKKNARYDDSYPWQFKLKTRRLNTVDFLLKYDEHNCYYVLFLGQRLSYTKGYNRDMIRNSQYYDLFNMTSNPMTSTDQNASMLLVYSNTYYRNSHILKPRDNFDKQGFFYDDIQTIQDMMNDMMINHDKYSNKIMECAWAEDGWVPMHLRDDKKYPNNYMVGIDNISIVFNPFRYGLHTTYFQLPSYVEDENVKSFKLINRAIRCFVFEYYINTYSPNHVMDLCCGRGADIARIYCAGASQITAIDADRSALVEYNMRSTNIHNGLFRNNKLTMYRGVVPQATCNANYRPINVDIHYGLLDVNNNDLIDRILSRDNWYDADVILMNYAIHYLGDNINKLRALYELVNKCLAPGGKFICTFYDGDKILKDLGKDNHIGDKPFDITRVDKPDTQEVQFDFNFNPLHEIPNTVKPIEYEQIAKIDKLSYPFTDEQLERLRLLYWVNNENIEGFESRLQACIDVYGKDISFTPNANMCQAREMLSVSIEKGVTPFNTYFSKFISKHPEVDKYFGGVDEKDLKLDDVVYVDNGKIINCDDRVKINNFKKLKHSDDEVTYLRMPLPSIDTSGYRVEPAISPSIIQQIFINYEFDMCYPSMTEIVLNHLRHFNFELKLCDYMKYNCVCILTKPKEEYSCW